MKRIKHRILQVVVVIVKFMGQEVIITCTSTAVLNRD